MSGPQSPERTILFSRLRLRTSIKKRGELPVACPTNWGLRIALLCWTDNVRPTPIWVHTTRQGNCYTSHLGKCRVSPGCGIFTPVHLPLLCSWQSMKVAKFQFVKNIASSKRFNMSCLPLPCPAHSGRPASLAHRRGIEAWCLCCTLIVLEFSYMTQAA